MKRIISIVFGLVFSFAGVLHFKNEENFRRIVPSYLPFKKTAVLVTGVIECVFGILLLIKQPTNGLKNAITAFLLAVFPANIYMARKKLPLGDKPLSPWALYLRLPMQFLLISIIRKL
ncbi:hypothetical protein MHZ36_11850 [Staphylococcus sp. ACRSN]|uniref:DoxX family protein n=1 Tax=Staphylococcus sp. ACRSN TaxID=2918214 RepID=UPI001EF2478D|nr:MauE/DoxX family redox-associated membrane protein [Staphylococcus sp. ACRSN]MCG7339982.1 hypothetical protein [Staphylococcus sp. ACRSN]